MPDEQTMQRLKEHEGSIVLCRYLDFQPDGTYSLATVDAIEKVIEEPAGIQFQGRWIPFGENLTADSCFLRTGIVDIKTQRGEVLYKNESLKGLWRYPENRKDGIIL